MENLYKIKLKKNDTVIVLKGKDKGKTGKVLAIHHKSNKVTVEGINMYKKHLKPNKLHPQGGITDITMPMFVSKVSIVDPSTKKPSKIGFKLDGNGTKTRIYKSSGKEIK